MSRYDKDLRRRIVFAKSLLDEALARRKELERAVARAEKALRKVELELHDVLRQEGELRIALSELERLERAFLSISARVER